MLIADWHFMGLALRELRTILGVARLKITRRLSEGFVVVESDRSAAEMDALMKEAKPVFIDALLPLLAVATADAGYGPIAGALEGIADKGTTFRIEALRIGSVIPDKAKSVEVALGNIMEGHGYHADMDRPECTLFLILHGNQAFVSRAVGASVTLDWYRAFNRARYDALNRSEMKLDEAVRYFGVGINGSGLCLDIGAAPGGWTDYLAMRGRRVVAVDSAMLDYKRLCRYGSVVVAVAGSADDAAGLLAKIDSNIFAVPMEDADREFEGRRAAVLHVKSRLEGAVGVLRSLGRFGMITMDANVAPETACDIIGSVAGLADSGSVLIMTIKLVDNKIEERIKYVKEAISKVYGPAAVKKLPHNRMEVTLFARRR